MDDIVKQALAKWPDVPHCYGWLALDARGAWRMRDERAQAQGLPGDKINNAALRGFINRNYMHDAAGRWYFQNGPQRVYVDLETAPYVAHTDHAHGFVLQTGEALQDIDSAWLTDDGKLLLAFDRTIALVDDRDIAQCIARLRLDGSPVGDDRLLDWIENPVGMLTLEHRSRPVTVLRIAENELADRFGFARRPRDR